MDTPTLWTCGRCTLCKPGSSTACAACPAEAAHDGDLSTITGATLLPCHGSSREMALAAAVVDEDGGSNQLNSEMDNKIIKVMTYNVWFREDLELSRRMKALGDLIHLHNPDLICFQEITPNIYQILQKSGWWQEYKCSLSDKIDIYMERRYFCMQMSKLDVNSFDSIPFGNSVMERELCKADTNVGGVTKLVLATSHLESPCGRDQMYSKERAAQANESVRILDSFRNVIFCGDMNWVAGDGQFPLPGGWVDAWDELKPGEDGWTYDTEANSMISGAPRLQARVDRFVCKLPDFKIHAIEMIGKEAIPGLSYSIEKKLRKGIRKLELPVLPSDHFGLVLSITHAAPSGRSAHGKVSNPGSLKKKSVLHYFTTLVCGRAL
ncbi:hypothetical protein ACQ4PT_014397 [Festuca glaucescens]